MNSSHGYVNSGPTGHAPQGTLATDQRTVACTVDFDQVSQVAAAEGYAASGYNGLLAGVVDSLSPNIFTDAHALDQLQTGRLGPELLAFLAAAYVTAPCSHSGMLTDPASLMDVIAAVRSDLGRLTTTSTHPTTTPSGSAGPGQAPGSSSGSSTSASPSARGNHVLVPGADPCSVTAVRDEVAAAYGYSPGDVLCNNEPSSGTLEGNWYVPNGPYPAHGDSDRVGISVQDDAMQGVSSSWQNELGFLSSQPNAVVAGPTINGLPSLWENGSELITPYGRTLNVIVFMYASGRSGIDNPDFETYAERMASTIELALFH